MVHKHIGFGVYAQTLLQVFVVKPTMLILNPFVLSSAFMLPELLNQNLQVELSLLNINVC
jgi:hypothetical protein